MDETLLSHTKRPCEKSQGRFCMSNTALKKDKGENGNTKEENKISFFPSPVFLAVNHCKAIYTSICNEISPKQNKMGYIKH